MSRLVSGMSQQVLTYRHNICITYTEIIIKPTGSSEVFILSAQSYFRPSFSLVYYTIDKTLSCQDGEDTQRTTDDRESIWNHYAVYIRLI